MTKITQTKIPAEMIIELWCDNIFAGNLTKLFTAKIISDTLNIVSEKRH